LLCIKSNSAHQPIVIAAAPVCCLQRRAAGVRLAFAGVKPWAAAEDDLSEPVWLLALPWHAGTTIPLLAGAAV